MLIVLFTPLLARRWQGFENSWRFLGNLKKIVETRNSISLFYSCHRAFARFDSRCSGLNKGIEYLLFSPDNAISPLCFICLCALACTIVELIGGLEWIHQYLYFFVPIRTKVRLVHPWSWFKSQVANVCHWLFQSCNSLFFVKLFVVSLSFLIDQYFNLCFLFLPTFWLIHDTSRQLVIKRIKHH